MARRFRYSFANKQESGRGRLSAALCVAALILFGIAVALSGRLPSRLASVPGAIMVFAVLLNMYGFGLGLSGFQEAGKKHGICIVGSIANGMLLVGWLGLYHMGR